MAKNGIYNIRDQDAERIKRYQQAVKKSYDKKASLLDLSVGDYVLRKIQGPEGQGKLTENWEGPFIFIKKYSSGACYLETLNGQQLLKLCSSFNLKKFFM